MGRSAKKVNEATGGEDAGLAGVSLSPAGNARAINGWAAGPSTLPSPFNTPAVAVTMVFIGGSRLLRDAAAALFDADDELQVLGSYESAADYLQSGAGPAPDVMLLDCNGGGPECWERAITSLRAPYAHSKILMLCAEAREDVISCAIDLRVGGVVLREYTTAQIRDAIVYVATGRTVMPAGWQQMLTHARPLALSPRQRQILSLIAQGRGDVEIAAELELSTNTVKFHVRELYMRLGVRNRVEAANEHAKMSHAGE